MSTHWGCSTFLFVTRFAKRGPIHASNLATLMSHNDNDKAITITTNDRKIFLQNFKAVAQLQAELYLLIVEKLDACIRPFLIMYSSMWGYISGVSQYILM